MSKKNKNGKRSKRAKRNKPKVLPIINLSKVCRLQLLTTVPMSVNGNNIPGGSMLMSGWGAENLGPELVPMLNKLMHDGNLILVADSVKVQTEQDIEAAKEAVTPGAGD